MRIPKPPAPLPKVFVLATPGHFLAKLHWELQGFCDAEGRTIELSSYHTAAYHAMNCAITAWHMTDWVWSHWDSEGQEYLAEALGLQKNDQASFEAYVRSECRALNCCRDIATGSKHMKIRRSGSDPDVSADTEWSIELASVLMSVGDPIAKHRVCLMVKDRYGRRPARDVFEEAFRYWERLLSRHGFIEDQFIDGSFRCSSL